MFFEETNPVLHRIHRTPCPECADVRPTVEERQRERAEDRRRRHAAGVRPASRQAQDKVRQLRSQYPHWGPERIRAHLELIDGIRGVSVEQIELAMGLAP